MADYIKLWEEKSQSGTILKDDYMLKNLWGVFRRNVSMGLSEVNSLLDQVKKERGEFVLDPSYRLVLSALEQRSGLLSRLPIEPPTTPEEIGALRVVSKEYERLKANLLSTTEILSRYLKDLAAASSKP